MKIPPKRMPSDDCIIYVGRKIADGVIIVPGMPYRVHEGEWVEVIPVGSVSHYVALMQLQRGLKGDMALMESAMIALCAELANRIIAWNWTGNNGQPLPQPHDNPAAISALSEDEIAWLIQAVQGETVGERKNGSGAIVPNSLTPLATTALSTMAQ